MFTKALTAVAALTLAVPAFAQENPTVGGAEMMADAPIVENASNAPNLTTLVAAVQQAELVETLAGEGPFTVFAPTDDAFAMVPEDTLKTLMMDENRAQLQEILTCHVVAAEVFAADIMGMIEDDGGEHPVTTVGGCELTAYSENGEVKLRDENGTVATVTTADVDQSNGVVHVIDRVLLPAS